MKYLIMALLMSACSCGADDIRTKKKHEQDRIEVDHSKYKTIASATVNINGKSLSLARNSYSLAPTPIDSDIIYVNPEKGKFELEPGTINPVEAVDEDSIDMGTVEVSNININKLDICDPGGNTKCTSAIIRIYTVEQPGWPGIEGFVNTDDGYGLPILADGANIGLGVAGAVTLDSYVIPANRRRVKGSHFTDLIYAVIVDLDNAGNGNYAVTLRIEIAIGS